MNNLLYTFTFLDVEAYWAVKYILGEIKLPERDVMLEDWKKWHQRYLQHKYFVLY